MNGATVSFPQLSFSEWKTVLTLSDAALNNCNGFFCFRLLPPRQPLGLVTLSSFRWGNQHQRYERSHSYFPTYIWGTFSWLLSSPRYWIPDRADPKNLTFSDFLHLCCVCLLPSFPWLPSGPQTTHRNFVRNLLLRSSRKLVFEQKDDSSSVTAIYLPHPHHWKMQFRLCRCRWLFPCGKKVRSHSWIVLKRHQNSTFWNAKTHNRTFQKKNHLFMPFTSFFAYSRILQSVSWSIIRESPCPFVLMPYAFFALEWPRC